MNSIWMLAAANPAAESAQQTTITMEPAEKSSETGTVQKSTEAPSETPTNSQKTQGNPLLSMLPFLIIIVVMYLLLFRGPRKKQQEHQKMVSSLKKNDRVRTIGGIFGTVVDVRQDDIVLKIDESNNTKIHILPSAVGTVLSDEKK